MHSFLKQSTASQSRAIGPFLDDTDFKTAETALTIANTDVKLIVNGGASANKNSGGGTHRANGVYGLTFDATDTATVGEMHVSVIVSGALPVFATFVVVEEAVYAALFEAAAPGYLQPTTAGRTLDVSAGGEAGIDWANIGGPTTAQNLSGTSTKAVEPTVAGRTLDVSATGEAGVDWANVGGQGTTVNLSATTTNVVNTATATTTVSGLAANVITATSIAANAITAAKVATDAIGAAQLAADAVTEIQAGLSTLTQANIRTAVGLASANLDTQLSTIDDFLDTEVAAIKAKTDQLAFTVAGQVDANTESINATTVLGTGTSIDKWRG